MEFTTYHLKRTTRPLAFAPPEDPIATSVNIEPLLQGAVALEDARFEQGEDDSEGLGVMSRPSSPLLEVEAVEPEDAGLAEAPAQPHPSSGTQSGAKKGRNAGASIRRAKK